MFPSTKNIEELKERNRMNDQVNTIPVEQAESMVAITDVKHYAVDIDADGNEVRREIPALDIPGKAEPTEASN